jgi:hypothetical protein
MTGRAVDVRSTNMPLTDDEAITLVLLHGATWHQSTSEAGGALVVGEWAVWKGDEGGMLWSVFAKPTFGEACRDYCRRHGLGQE